jgi:benzodiazapine receptor
MQNIFKVNGMFKPVKLIISLVITLGTGVIGSLFSMNSKDVYYSLNLPSFAPPAATFGIVWTLLFIIMGIAFYRVWMYYSPDKNNPQDAAVKDALIYFIVQLIFNVLWSVLFFALNLKTAALFDVVILLFYIIVTTIKFYKIDKIAAYLMIPYIIWVIFAAILNMSIIFLN